VPAARAGGLGAAVAGSVPPRTAGAVVAATVLVSGAAGVLLGPPGAVRCAVAALAGTAAAEALLRRCAGRFGGVTGDVFGALCETAVTAAFVVLALGR
jgi:adenosylcobinamide-GDP ribazoletransferase